MRYGTWWLKANKHLGLIVPSAILPLENNLVITQHTPPSHKLKWVINTFEIGLGIQTDSYKTICNHNIKILMLVVRRQFGSRTNDMCPYTAFCGSEALAAQRTGISRQTWRRLEAGEPSASLGLMFEAMAIYGFSHQLFDLADPELDLEGQAQDAARRPKKAAPTSKLKIWPLTFAA